MATSPRPVAPPVGQSPAGPSRRRRALAWGLALTALAFVAYVVPLRDRCEDSTVAAAPTGATPAPPGGAKPVRVPLSRDADGGGCVLHRSAQDEHLTAQACAALTCEPGLVSTFARVRPGMLAGLLALYFFATFAWAARWRALLALAKVPITLLETWRITLEAQAGGVVLPGGVGGDALRVGFVAGKGASLPTVIAAVLLDRAIGLATLAGLAAVFSATTLDGGAIPTLLFVLGSIPVAFVVGLVLLRRGPLARAPFFVRGPLAPAARPVLAYLGAPGAPRAIVQGVLISLVVSSAQLLTIRGFVTALAAVPTRELWVYVGGTMSFIVGAIPALPGGWGTSDAAFVYFFAKAGLVPSLALAVSLLYRLFWYSSGAVGALLYLLRSHESAPRKA